MTWFLRKSFSKGPVRINLSKSGLGVSVGVKGLRVGTGPKGSYVEGGRDGLYFRESLNRKSNAHNALNSDGSDPSEAVEIVDTPVNKSTIVVETPGFCTSRKIGFFKNKLELTYTFPENFEKFYSVFIAGFRKASECSAIWNVNTQHASRDAKYTAGATNIIERSLTQITFDDDKIQSNVSIAWLHVAGGKLALLPEKMVFFGNGDSFELLYKDVTLETSVTKFREEGHVPQDSVNVGMTWQYVDKKGGPDHRFAHNKQIPIQLYSTLRFVHQNLTFSLEFSNSKMAPFVKTCIEAMAKNWKQG